MQNSLLPLATETPPAPQGQEGPIFGVQASWICYGCGIVDALTNDRGKGGHQPPDPSDHADVAFLYLAMPNAKGPGWRITCPAIGFDEEGEHKDIFPRFLQAAHKTAGARSGLTYGDRDSCITTAWRGETFAEKRAAIG